MSERSRVYYTTIFLHISFQAIKRSLAGKKNDTQPCWLDSTLLLMLSRELESCRMAVGPSGELRQALDNAYYHCGLLLAQCPGALTSKLCHHHLDAILAPLQQASAMLSSTPSTSGHGFWAATTRRLRQGWPRSS
ncbi:MULTISPECIES: hypothetical protein [Halomonadaceae]|uniref:hypothetical protein n=1 Tax=Halomonadaceae TaxID=28256 RepID=UPI0015990CC1|nr:MULTISPECIES: hypothetical protein [Halomonas]QJQ94808.1 hypothetical protein HIO72_05595 [Halomonas sp. PA5]